MVNTVANIVHGPAALTIDGVAVGFTEGGVTLRSAKDILRVMADQATGTMKMLITSESMFITTTLLETTVANMAKVMGCSSSSATGGSFGAESPTLAEHTVAVTGLGPSGATRTWTFYRASQAEDVESMIGGREDVNKIPLALELMKDPAHNYLFGSFVDVAAGT